MRIEISIDDAGIEDIRIAEIIKKHSLESDTVFYWPVMPRVIGMTKGRFSMNDQQMGQIAKEFEIGSHTITHRLLTRIPIDEAKTEIVESKKILEEKFGIDIKKFCWPRGYTSPDLKAIARQAGYESARGVLVGSYYENDRFNQSTAVHLGYDRKEYGGKSWFDYAMDMLDRYPVGDEDAVFKIWMHGYEMGKYAQAFELFDDLLDNIKQRMET